MKRLLLVVLISCSKKPAPAPTTLPAAECMTPDRALVVAMSNVDGYVEPCGCMSHPLGGVAKLAAFWAEQKRCQKDPVLVTVGNLLFDGPVPETKKEQEETKARLIADIYKEMGAAAQVPGSADKASSLVPWLKGAKTVESAGLKLVFVGVEEGQPAPTGVTGDAVIALAALPWEKARGLKGFDVIVSNGSPEPRSPVVVGSTLLIDAGTQGQHAGLIEFVKGTPAEHWTFFDGGSVEVKQSKRQLQLLEREIAGMDTAAPQRAMQIERRDNLKKRISELETTPPPPPAQKHIRFTLMPLTTKLPDAPDVKKQIAGYNAKLCEFSKRSTESLACPPLPEGQPGYVGSDKCGSCHAPAFKQWQTQKHAHAVKTLEDAGKYCDLSCIGCHTTGFNKAGGFCSPQKVGELKEVGCEMCHGAGSLHAAVPSKATIIRAPTENTCLQCHTKEHSDQFQFEAYRLRIIGAGHGG